MDWYLKVLRQYADFNGRARRKEFWIFILISAIISWVTVALDYALGTNIEGFTTGVINIVYALAIFIPYLAVAVRRLHDIGKSGWMFLIIFIPIVGPIWLIVLWATDSNPDENKYGPNPKKDKGESEFKADTDEDKIDDKYESSLNQKGENALKSVIKETPEETDSFTNIIIIFLISVFIGCASYALLSITQIIDNFQNSERIKNVVLIVFALASFIVLLNSNLKQAKK